MLLCKQSVKNIFNNFPLLVKSKVPLNLTTLSLKRDLEQLILVEDIHASRHESKVCISTRDCKDTEQFTRRVPAVILQVSSHEQSGVGERATYTWTPSPQPAYTLPIVSQ